MAETKTKPTGASVDAYLASRASPAQLADCKAIMAMCKRVTKQQPKMWGPSIVGYGSYTYRYESGHSGDACLTGFAVRGKDLVVYLIAENPEQVELMAKLGRHKMGKACLYFKRLADLDAKVLEALIAGSVAEVRRRYPHPGDAQVGAAQHSRERSVPGVLSLDRRGPGRCRTRGLPLEESESMATLKPVTPGELLLDEFLVSMELSRYRLAKKIDVPAQRIGEIVAGKRAITADTD